MGHYRHQTIVHVLGLAPWPNECNCTRIKKRYFRPTPSSVAILLETIPPSILALAFTIAGKLYEEETGPSVDQDAINQPLPPTKKGKP